MVVFVALALVMTPVQIGTPKSDTLKVEIDIVGSRPYVVGQAIDLQVRVQGDLNESLVLKPPIPADADLVSVDSLESPLLLDSTSQRRFAFRLVPRKEGELRLPAFQALQRDQSGRSRGLLLSVTRLPSLPSAPSWFLGGVGPIEVEQRLDPPQIRLGETTKLEIELRGPGAIGSLLTPLLPDFDRTGLNPAVEQLPVTSSIHPPHRIFRFQFRPTEAGEVTLGPLRVAWFDPKFRRFQTVISNSVTLAVANPPVLALDLIELPETPPSRVLPRRFLTAVMSAVVFVGILLFLFYRLKRFQRSDIKAKAKRCAKHQARRILKHPSTEVDAATIANALGCLVEHIVGRPVGAITAQELRRALGEVTREFELADRAEGLLRWADQLRFDPTVGSIDRQRLQETAERFFQDLSRSIDVQWTWTLSPSDAPLRSEESEIAE